MLEAYGVETIRQHEAAAIAKVGDDTLMQRAASGLAAAVARAAELGIGTIHVSLSHDAGIASAVVICEA